MNSLVISSLAMMSLPLSAHATENWLCTHVINGKSLDLDYEVSDTLLANHGKGHLSILENDADHLVAYIAFTENVSRYPVNSAPVVVSEPMVSYTIIEKGSGRLTELHLDQRGG